MNSGTGLGRLRRISLAMVGLTATFASRLSGAGLEASLLAER